jgi:hypothetical protein
MCACVCASMLVWVYVHMCVYACMHVCRAYGFRANEHFDVCMHASIDWLIIVNNIIISRIIFLVLFIDWCRYIYMFDDDLDKTIHPMISLLFPLRFRPYRSDLINCMCVCVCVHTLYLHIHMYSVCIHLMIIQ